MTFKDWGFLGVGQATRLKIAEAVLCGISMIVWKDDGTSSRERLCDDIHRW